MAERDREEGGEGQRTDSRDVQRALALKSQREHHLEVLETKLEESEGEAERRQARAEFATRWTETLFWIWELHLDNPEVSGEGLKEELVRTHQRAAEFGPSPQEGTSSSERRLAGLGWEEVEKAMATFRDN